MTVDIALKDDGAPKIAQGDWVVEPSAEQQVNLLLVSVPGNWKQFPFVGIDYLRALNEETSNEALRQRIQNQIELDGGKVDKIELGADGAEITGRYD